MSEPFKLPEPGKLFRSVKNKVVRVLKRVGLHVALNFGIAAAAMSLGENSPVSLAFAGRGDVVLYFCTYLGLLLLFPMRMDVMATVYGVILAVAGAWLLSPFWFLAVAAGGIVTFILTTRKRRRPAIGSMGALALLMLSMLAFKVFPYLTPTFYIVSAGVLACGLFLPDFYERRQLRKLRDAQLLEEQRRQAEILAEQEGKETYELALIEMIRLRRQLPTEVSMLVSSIEARTRAIMKCMREDLRDVNPGARFLNRYLPMINRSLEGFIRIAELKAAADEVAQAQLQVRTTLITMDKAFAEKHQRLLNNDLDDLKADLSVMDKLVRSDGYKS